MHKLKEVMEFRVAVCMQGASSTFSVQEWWLLLDLQGLQQAPLVCVGETMRIWVITLWLTCSFSYSLRLAGVPSVSVLGFYQFGLTHLLDGIWYTTPNMFSLGKGSLACVHQVLSYSAGWVRNKDFLLVNQHRKTSSTFYFLLPLPHCNLFVRPSPTIRKQHHPSTEQKPPSRTIKKCASYTKQC